MTASQDDSDGDWRSVNGRLVCLDDFERYAVKTMAAPTLGFIRGGADDELTLSDNVAAFRRSLAY